MSALSRRLGRIRPWWRRFKRNGYRVDRCAHCGHRFAWSGDARHANGNREGKVFHGPCLTYLHWRAKADERLAMLAVVMDLSGLTARDVKGAVELRAESESERIATNSQAFRVLYDLEKLAHAWTVATEGREQP